jgi:hypothetical protein
LANLEALLAVLGLAPSRSPTGKDGVVLVNANEKQLRSLDLIEQGLESIGYSRRVRQRGYTFADFFAETLTTRTVDLAAFARDPFSYDTACIAAASANGCRGPELVKSLRALGAPMVFEINLDGDILRWKLSCRDEATLLQQIPANRIAQTIQRHSAEWSPDSVFRAKCIPQYPRPRQLDFIDAGLMPAIGQTVSRKLHDLLESVIVAAKSRYEANHGGSPPEYAPLFRLIFRFIAAKVLGDRRHPGNWLSDDPDRVIDNVERFYFRSKVISPVLGDRRVHELVWRRIRDTFHFENISVDALAYIYENTLVSSEKRAAFGTHSTPLGIAEYLVRNLPFENLAQEERCVLEPCAGHGVFLVAAMRRIRELLPINMSASQRHDYFVQRLAGIEVDSFACEVARLSLMLADYPNPNGWRIHQEDIFDGKALGEEMKRATIVLCNPPFEDFTEDEQSGYGSGIRHIQKPAEILRRVLEPGSVPMLGFVLPRVFISGRSYKEFHAKIGTTYSNIELVGLPDGVFAHSDAESVLLLAYERKATLNAPSNIRSSSVSKSARYSFLATGELSHSRQDEWLPGKISLWTPPLQDTWDALAHLPMLRDCADVHRGIEFSVPLTPSSRSGLISESKKGDFVRGLERVTGRLEEAFICPKHVWINVSKDVMRGNACDLPWQNPKVIVNAARTARGPWRMIAVPDQQGLVCYQCFHGIWPRKGWDVRVLAAILNGPVANAYVFDQEYGRHNKAVTIGSIPMPRLDQSDVERLAALVYDYTSIRESRTALLRESSAELRLRSCLEQIDGILLRAYGLSPRLERKLLDEFGDYQRPVPFTFSSFFPKEFNAYIPYHEYASPEFRRAGATETLKRIRPIRDEAIHEAMEHLRVLDEDEG